MKVLVRVVPFNRRDGGPSLGYHEANELETTLEWPEGFPLPPEGVGIDIPNHPVNMLFVRHVAWYPWGSEGETDPYILVILGGKRPE